MKKVVLLFPGQGSQYPGMGKELCKKHEIANKTFDEASEIAGFNLKKVCFDGSQEELTKTENAQPTILTASIAAYRVLNQEFSLKPQYMAGHSLGEYSALVCSGAIDFQDALQLVRQRGLFMKEAEASGKGAMAAIAKLEYETIKQACEKINCDNECVVISTYNSSEQIVISGHKSAVETVSSVLKNKGGMVIPLQVSGAFHSPLMQGAAKKMELELKKYTYKEMNVQVISNVDALPYSGPGDIVDKLTKQLTESVLWTPSMAYLKQNGVTMGIELGPGSVLKNLMKHNQKDITVYSFDKEKDSKNLQSELGMNAEKKSPLFFIGRCLALAASAKNHNFNTEEYTKGVIMPYKKINELYIDLAVENKEPTEEQVTEAMHMLQSVLQTKKISLPEQKDRLDQLFAETRMDKFRVSEV